MTLLRKQALTLVELVLVLLILVISTTVILQSTQRAVEQSRFDGSRRSLEQIRAAVLGSETLQQPDGTPLIQGFVNDMGRLPKSLNELFDSTSMPTFEARQDATVTEIELFCGWRGPYIRLPLGKADLTDSYNQTFDVTLATTPLSADDLIETVSVSGTARSAPFDAALSVTFSSNEFMGTVTGSLTISGAAPGAGDTIEVRCYYPNGDESSFDLTSKLVTVTGSSSFIFTEIPIGYRCIRAVQTVGGTATSEPQYFHLLPQTTASLNLNLAP